MSVAIRSTTGGVIATASPAEALTALRTAFSAHASLRPCALARAVIRATASLVTFSASVLGRSFPELSTTAAAPMLVSGAIAATSPASVTKVAALAARAPFGVT